MKRTLLMMIGITMMWCVHADMPQVQNVTAKQRFPWNGLVDVNCKVTGINGTTNWLGFALAIMMPDSGNVRKISHYWVVQNGTKTTDCTVHTNGDYRLLWDAKADLGLVIYSNIVVRITVDHSKVQLWEGGPYWAEKNIGAEVPWEYGYYFWWGDTVGYKYEDGAWVASAGSTSGFSFSSEDTPTNNKSIDTLKSEGWITADNVLTSYHDAAHVKWGGGWRMPTVQELHNLNNNCDWTWATTNGVNGYIVRGRGDYANASIFLPASGDSLGNAGSFGYYWSSVPGSGSYDAYGLYFASGGRGTGIYGRSRGQSVRPVQGFTE